MDEEFMSVITFEKLGDVLVLVIDKAANSRIRQSTVYSEVL